MAKRLLPTSFTGRTVSCSSGGGHSHGLSGHAIPGMIHGRLVPRLCALASLGPIDRRMHALVVVQRDRRLALGQQPVGQHRPAAQHGDRAVEALAHRHRGAAQPVRRGGHGELILPPRVLKREVLGDLARGVEGENQVQLRLAVQHRAVGIQRAGRLDDKAGVVIGHERGQKRIGGLDIVDAA